MQKLLIISYYWPPAGGPGVQRWVKFSKYLNRMHYSCHVVTVDEQLASYPAIDKTLEKDVDAAIKVTKTRSFEALKVFSSVFKKEKVPYAGIPDKSKMSAIGKLALYIRSNFFIPDARKGWNKYALAACKKIIEEEKIDVIVTTSPPHSTQLIGLALKKQFPHIKWVADMRDPWTDIYYYPKLSHTESSKRKDKNLEREVLLNADMITTVSADLKRLFLEKSGKINAGKIHVLANGFDEEDFKNIAAGKNQIFTITHTGTINSNYNITGFLQALKKLASGNTIKLKFVGNVDTIIRQQLIEAIPDVEFTPYIAHKEAVQLMCTADLLLLAIPDNPDNKGILTGKLFEYLAAQKPILCLGPPNGDAAGIIRDCSSGKTYCYDDEGNILLYLQHQYNEWSMNKTTKLNSTNYRVYSREELAKKIAALI
ncbi:MAG TPA: glycosyltransferase family 4 protein [Bacteroidia bacterium]|nr:glycosyltransferase family 4 protein [Bacteroidia bacterium]